MANQDAAASAIRPTLFLGLGGTGKEVLLRLRRRFYEKFGQPSLPCTSFLWIDTDTNDHMAQGEAMDDTYAAVTFQDVERIGLLEGKVKDHLQGVFENRNQWRHVHRWLPSEVERYGGEISDGAGGVRAVGRLAFFFHFGAIRDRIQKALGRIALQERINETKQISQLKNAEFRVKPQVFLVCSVAGGTGCGTVLDIAFLLNDLRGISLERRIGVIFMPNVYHESTIGEAAQRSYGNAYAALKELEFYTLRRKPAQEGGSGDDAGVYFEVEWEPNDPNQRPIPGPPLSLTYLLEIKNEGGIGLETRPELFHMVAESLYLDFMPGQFSSAKRSQYANVVQYLSGTDGNDVRVEGVVLPQVFARRYATFGMSKIEVPEDRLNGACASQLAADIIAHWNREPEETNFQTDLIEEIEREGRFKPSGIWSRFGEEWRNIIQAKLRPLFRTTLTESGAVDEITNQIDEFERKILRSEGGASRWGQAIAAIRTMDSQVKQELRKDLEDWIRESLDSPVRGLRALVKDGGYLDLLTFHLRGYYQSEEEGDTPDLLSELEGAKADADYYDRARMQVRAELKEALRSFWLGGLRLREWAIDELLGRWREAEEQHALAQAFAALMEETIEVTRDSVIYLEEKRAALFEFERTLSILSGRFRQKRESFLDFAEGVLFIRIFDREKDWPNFYALGLDEHGRRIAVAPHVESRRFIQQYSGFDRSGLWEVAERFPDEGVAGLQLKLFLHCERLFIEDFEVSPRTTNVLEHPQLRGRRKETIERLVRSALPMARIDARLGPRSLKIEKRAYLGIASADGSVYQEFIDSVKKAVEPRGYNLDVLVTAQEKEIYLHLIAYAFPLPALPVVTDDCHGAYYAFYKALRGGAPGEQGGQIPLHLSVNWEGRFEDLQVHSDREAKQLKESLEALLFGGILNVIGLSETEGQLEYDYKKWMAPNTRRVWLGNRLEAIEALQGDTDLCNQILAEVQEREKGEGEELVDYYWLLAHLQSGNRFVPGTPEGALLDGRLGEIASRLSERTQESLSLDDIAVDQRQDEIRRRIKGEVEWVTDLPIMTDLPQWVLGRSTETRR